MFCSKCGNEIKEGDMFCEKCGAEVNNEKIVNENEQMQSKNYFNLDFSGMNLFGIASAIVTIISVFLPCISVTLFGTTLHINYIQGDGIFVLIIGIIAVIAAMFNKNIILIILGILDFIMYVFLSSNLSTQYLNILNKGIGYYLLPIGAILIVLSGIKNICKKKHQLI